MFGSITLALGFKPKLEIDALKRALASNEHVVVAPQWTSWLDCTLFGACLPDRPLVVLTPGAEREASTKKYLGLFRHKTIDMEDPESLKDLVEVIRSERCCVIFPEAAPTSTGVLQRITDTAAAALARSGAAIVPARAVNTENTRFSRAGARLRTEIDPHLTLFAGEARRITSTDRSAAKREIDAMLRDTAALSLIERRPLFDSLLENRDRWGWSSAFAIEPDGSRISRKDFVTRVCLAQRLLEKHCSGQDKIGIMLPNTHMTLAFIIGAQRAGMVPAMMNYSMGARALLSCCDVAKIKSVITSRRFIKEGKLDALASSLAEGGAELLYLEDIMKGLSRASLLSVLIASLFARPSRDPEAEAAKTALVLFTSGSEGIPKAVALSHMNIQANTAQIRVTLPFWRTDVMLAVMPLFHSYGLCTGVFMPISTGMSIAFYPSPLQFKKIPQYAAEVGATVLLGTNAFLAGYAKNGSPADFAEMRFVVCGGDKMRDSTRDLWREKYGITLLEGYGVTECSPVVGVNKLGHMKHGSIGKPLPCIETRLEPVEGIEGAGRLFLRGPNIMSGYLKPDGSIDAPRDGWHDTGDICSIDEEGFITIEGRAKRFAKIGGEMVSLAHIEDAVRELWPDAVHAAVAVSDEKKGESIVLVTEMQGADIAELRSGLSRRGLTEVAMPRRIVAVDQIPMIGAGKVDFRAAAELAAGAGAAQQHDGILDVLLSANSVIPRFMKITSDDARYEDALAHPRERAAAMLARIKDGANFEQDDLDEIKAFAAFLRALDSHADAAETELIGPPFDDRAKLGLAAGKYIDRSQISG